MGWSHEHGIDLPLEVQSIEVSLQMNWLLHDWRELLGEPWISVTLAVVAEEWDGFVAKVTAQRKKDLFGLATDFTISRTLRYEDNFRR